jgi:hypothetical protein
VLSKDARTLGETTALVFMGERIGCARCRAHPQETWMLAASITEGKVLEVKPGSDTPIVIQVRRKDGVKAGVTITAVRLANNTITTKGVFVAPEKDEAEIVLNVAKDAKVGLRQDMIVSGLMRANNQSIVRYARAIPVMVVAK